MPHLPTTADKAPRRHLLEIKSGDTQPVIAIKWRANPITCFTNSPKNVILQSLLGFKCYVMLAVLPWNLSVTSWELNTMVAVAGSALAVWFMIMHVLPGELLLG